MARHSGHLRGVVVARKVDVILDEHSEVFGTVQERGPEREAKWGSVGQWDHGLPVSGWGHCNE